jgi:hypothetical protein
LVEISEHHHSDSFEGLERIPSFSADRFGRKLSNIIVVSDMDFLGVELSSMRKRLIAELKRIEAATSTDCFTQRAGASRIIA